MFWLKKIVLPELCTAPNMLINSVGLSRGSWGTRALGEFFFSIQVVFYANLVNFDFREKRGEKFVYRPRCQVFCLTNLF